MPFIKMTIWVSPISLLEAHHSKAQNGLEIIAIEMSTKIGMIGISCLSNGGPFFPFPTIMPEHSSICFFLVSVGSYL